jgi:O-antigen ligase
MSVVSGHLSAMAALPGPHASDVSRRFRVTTRSVTVAALLALMFLNVLNYSSAGELGNGLRIAYARLPVLVVALLLLIYQFRGRFSALLMENYDVALFVAWATIGSIVSSSPLVSFSYAAWLGASLLFLLILMQCFPEPGSMIRAVDQTLLVAYAFPVVLGVIAIPGYLSGGLRLSGDLDVHQVFAWSAVIVIGAMMNIASIERRRGRTSLLWHGPVSTTILAVCFVCIVFSGNRGSVLGMGVLFAVYLLGGTIRRRSFARYAIGLIAGVLVAQSYIQSFTANRYRTLFEQQELSSSDQLRAQIYKANWEYGLQHPILGGGLLTAAVEVAKSVPGAPAGYAAHSTYMEMISEMGLAGFAIFLIIGGRSIWLLWQRPEWRDMRVYVLMLGLPVLIMAATESDLTPGQALFFPLWLAILLPRGMNPRIIGNVHVE